MQTSKTTELVSTAAPVSDRELSSLSGWRIAEVLGCHYSGDSDPIQHGGYFYSSRDWEGFGYASVVEFWLQPDAGGEGTLIVQRGTISRSSDPAEMEEAFRCCGIEPGSPERGNIHVQIDAVRSYCGIEPDGISYPALKAFDLATWRQEWRVWKSVRGWIEVLSG